MIAKICERSFARPTDRVYKNCLYTRIKYESAKINPFTYFRFSLLSPTQIPEACVTKTRRMFYSFLRHCGTVYALERNSIYVSKVL